MSLRTIESSLWNTVKNGFQSLFPNDVFRTWFEPLNCINEEAESLSVSVPNEFAAIWVQDNYEDLITRKLSEAAGRPMQVKFCVVPSNTEAGAVHEGASDRSVRPPREESSGRGSSKTASDRSAKRSKPQGDLFLNPRNTFENFVVGSGNQLAHAASTAVANNPGRAYNPLFLYGDTGLGKTHLMQSIAHQVHGVNADACIAYISTENFTNHFIEAIQSNTVVRFRQRYRKVNILLIDDVQFLAGKERIQEEFFHTFNQLFEQQSQIVITSDRPASEISKLESRLVSRFQWGMVADIQAPDLETRMAILSKKARLMNLNLSDEIIGFLAEKVSRNVRRMEGALNRVGTYTGVVREKLTVQIVEHLLHDLLNEDSPREMSLEKIQEEVATHYKVTVEEMTGRRRPANLVLPRQVAMHLCRVMTSHSLQEIGRAFGGRDHATVIHANKTIETLIENNSEVASAVALIQAQIEHRS